MFRNFSSEARRVIIQARQLAGSLENVHLGQQHFFVTLLKQDDGAPSAILQTAGFQQKHIHIVTRNLLTPGGRVWKDQEIPFTFGARRMVENAVIEAHEMGTLVEPIHLFLGIIKEPHGEMRNVLNVLGIEYTELRAQAISYLNS